MGGYATRAGATTDAPVSRAGEVYRLGRHVLVCGDARVINGRVPPGHVLVYDPPWDADPIAPVITYARAHASSTIAFGDGQTIGGLFTLFGPPAWVFTWDTGAPWSTGPRRPLKATKLAAWFGDLEQYDRDATTTGPPPPGKDHPGTTFQPGEGRRLTDLWRQSLRWHHAGAPHPHMKPLGWVRALLGNATRGPVVDPFAGSGQTMFAADQLDRDSVNIELDPHCCDIVRARWGRYCTTRGVDPGRDALDPRDFPDVSLDVSDHGGHVATLKTRPTDDGDALFPLGSTPVGSSQTPPTGA